MEINGLMGLMKLKIYIYILYLRKQIKEELE